MSAPPRRCPALPAPGWEPGSNAPLHKEPKTHTAKTTSEKERARSREPPAPRKPRAASALAPPRRRSARAALRGSAARRIPAARPGAPLPSLALAPPAGSFAGRWSRRSRCRRFPSRGPPGASVRIAPRALTYPREKEPVPPPLPSTSVPQALDTSICFTTNQRTERGFLLRKLQERRSVEERERIGEGEGKKKKRAEHNNNILRVQMWIEIPQRCTCL